VRASGATSGRKCYYYYYYYYYYKGTDFSDRLQQKNLLLGHFSKLQKNNVPINNVNLAKRQVKQVSYSHLSERQQGVRISYIGRQTVPGAHRCDRQRSVAKCGTPSWRQLQRPTVSRTQTTMSSVFKTLMTELVTGNSDGVHCVLWSIEPIPLR